MARVLALTSILAVAVPGAVQGQVEAPWPGHRRGDGYTYYKETEIRSPRHGYSGFAGIGPRLRYCDYRRIPNRVCDRKGCRVRSWTLEQYCY
jgi:hypothetical protein